jgi:hypothetical protein
MSYDESDARHEEGMNYLYEQFKIQYESEFIFERIDKFYEENRWLTKAPLKNLSCSTDLFERQYYSSSFLHAIISIEVGIKSVILKPILYSLAINDKAGDLLYSQTFKQKSLQHIPEFYYKILEEITGLNFKNKNRDDCQTTIWQEWIALQDLRNNVLHQGVSVERAEAENALKMASYVCREIIPAVLDRFYSHIENDEIQAGSREYASRLKRQRNK